MNTHPRWFTTGIFVNGFVIGFVLMGFEMLVSRYLNPYFGSGIVTWAALISVVLGALMAGYFLGGALVDRHPNARWLAYMLLLGGICFFVLPHFADNAIEAVIDVAGDGAGGALAAAMALVFVPLTLLGTFSPFGVRLLLDATHRGGRITGWVYGISTAGNILGILVTTFYLIPSIGTRMITTVFAVIVVASSLCLLAMDRMARRSAP